MLYQKPEMEILKFETEDVVRTSGTYHNPDDPDNVNDTGKFWPE